MLSSSITPVTRWSRLACAAAFALTISVPASAFALCETSVKDKDKDGLTDCTETFITHTNKRSADTDADGVSDGLEVASGLDPLLADTDADGVDDGTETVAGTDPLSSDSDSDGIDDSVDSDPSGRLGEHLGGTVTAVDLLVQNISLLGLTVDVSNATFRHIAALADVTVGMHVEIGLDAAAAATGIYTATEVRVDDINGDGSPDNGTDDSSDSGSGDSGSGDSGGSDSGH